MSLVRYELGLLSQKAAFFIATAVETSNLTKAYDVRRPRPWTVQLTGRDKLTGTSVFVCRPGIS
jgi:hypothetical protein